MGGRLTHRRPLKTALAWLVLAAACAPAAAVDEPLNVRVRLTIVESGTPNDLFSVSFPDPRHGFIGGVDGTILATTDGGATWTAQDAPLNRSTSTISTGPLAGDMTRREHITGVSFTDARTGHFVTVDGSVLSTTDGGATWIRRTLPPPSDFPAARRPDGVFPPSWQFLGVHFPDRDHGWAVGPEGMILATADAGATWTYQGNQRFGGLDEVRFTDRDHGYAVGYLGQRADKVDFVAVATTDGGRTWEPRQSPEFRRAVPSINFAAVSFVDPQQGHVVGGDGRIAATRDGGRRWRLRRSGTAEDLNGVAFADARRGLATGVVNFEGFQRSVVLATDDGGENWTPTAVPGRTHLWGGVAFADAGTAYAVGCGNSEDRCQKGLIVKIEFPPRVEAGESSGRSPLLVVGAGALLVVGAALVVRRRRSRYRY